MVSGIVCSLEITYDYVLSNGKTRPTCSRLMSTRVNKGYAAPYEQVVNNVVTTEQ